MTISSSGGDPEFVGTRYPEREPETVEHGNPGRPQSDYQVDDNAPPVDPGTRDDPDPDV